MWFFKENLNTGLYLINIIFRQTKPLFVKILRFNKTSIGYRQC